MFNKGGLIIILLLIGMGFFCCFPGQIFATDAEGVVINEICWMGMENSSDEWIEFYNNDEQDINLEGWGLYEAGGEILIEPLTGIIKGKSYYLIERTNDNTVPDIEASQPPTSWGGYGLNNDGEDLQLLDANLIIVDEVNCEEEHWFAGSKDTKQTMERIFDGWQTSAEAGGTPKAENSELALVDETAEDVGFCGDGVVDAGEKCDDNNNTDDDGCSAGCLIETSETEIAPSDTDDNQNEEPAASQTSNSLVNKLGYVVINELVSDPGDDEVEWIELYNTTSFEIDLDGWSITEGSGAATALTGTLEGIGQEKFFVLEKPKGNLNNSGDILFLRDSTGKLIDKVAYGDWDDGYLDNNALRADDPYSIARKFDGLNSFNNANDFALTASPTKGASNIITSDDDDLSEVAGDGLAAYEYSDDIIINEVFSNPVGSDSEIEFIELYNQGDKAVNLTGWRLGDASKKRHELGKDGAIIIKAEEYLVIYRSESKIALNNSSETVKLFQPLKDNPCQTVVYEKAVEGWSYNLIPATKADWAWSELVTPGAINEIKTVNHPPVVDFYCPLEAGMGEALEFDCSDTVDEDGDELTFAWDFGDNFTNNLAVVEHTYLEPGTYTISLTVSDGENSVKKEKIIKIKDSADMEGNTNDRADQSGIAPDLGQGQIIINEFLPNPDGPDADGEWVEIFNQGTEPVNLMDWQLDDSEQGSRPYLFVDELWLEAGAYLVIEREESGLALNNTSDAVRIFNPANSLIDEVAYDKVTAGQAYARDPAQAEQWAWTTSHTPGSLNIIVLIENNSGKDSAATVLKAADKKTPAEEIIATSLEGIRSLKLGSMVKVCGTVAVLPGILGSQYFYIVGSPGVQVYNYNKNFPDLAPGDYIEVRGELAQSSGEWRVKTKQADDIVIIEKREPPQPDQLTCNDISEYNCGQLVTVTGEVVDKKAATLYLDDGSGEIIVYIKQATGISLTNIKEGDIVTVTGLVGLTKTSVRIMPRSSEDIYKVVAEAETMEPGQVLGASAGSDTWSLPARNKKLELFKYLLVLSGAGLMIFLILLMRAKVNSRI